MVREGAHMKQMINVFIIWGMSLFLLIGPFSSGVFAQAPSYVYDFAWSPDGSRIVVARGESAVQVLDATTLQVLVTLQHPQVSALAWSPDGARLATGGWDETIRVWDPTTGQSLATIDSLVDRVTSIKWTSDGRYLIAAGFEVGYRIWDASTYEFIKTFMGGSYEIDLSPDNTQLAVAGWGGVGIVNVETGELIALLEGHQREVFSVAWSPDGTKLASGGYDGTMRLWDATTYQQMLVLQTPDNSIVRVVWSPDGDLIAGIGGGQLYIWNAVTGEQLAAFNILGRDIAWNPNEMEFIYSRSDATLELAHVLSGATCISTAPADPPTYTGAAGDTAGFIAAISAANANPDPDIIALEAGTYTLTAPNNTLYGKNGLPVINTPIIIFGNCATIERAPAAEAFRLFYVTRAGNLTLYDQTLTGGDGGTANGGAIYSQGTVTATNTTIANSTAPGGGGIRNSGGTLTLVDSRLENNSAPGTGNSGGGLYTNGPATLIDTTLTGNSAHYGGAIYTASGGTLTLTGCTVESNSAYSGGGAFINGGSLVVQSGSRFSANSVTSQGGALYNNGGSLSVSGSVIENNTAAGGGAIRNSGSLTLTGSRVTGNSTTSNGGGLLHLSGTVTLTDVTLSANQSGMIGGAIFAGGTLTLTGCYVSDNSALNHAGGIYTGGTLTLNTSQVVNNTSGRGGGGIFSAGGSVSLTGSTVAGNSAVAGGGGIASEGRLTITDSRIESNQAGTTGGGVYNDNRYSPGISNSCIVGNTAPQAGGVYSVTASFPASNTWWGAADGPAGSGPGSGDAINVRVLYSPFLTGGCPH